MIRAMLLSSLLALALPAPGWAGEAPPFEYHSGPVLAKIGDLAELKLPAGYKFVDKDNCAGFMEATGNFPSGAELGIVLSKSGKDSYFAIYEFEEVGYIKDASKEKIDADEILTGLKEGTEAANKERKERGWSEMHVLGWESPPAYNAETQRLEWAIKAQGGEGEIVNYFTRVLGRKGVMKVTVVCDTPALPAVRKEFQARMQDFAYTDGNKYAEFKEGDKVAKYGLAALILGGVAAKTGLLAKLGKLIAAMGKFIIVILIAAGAAIKKLGGKFFGKKEAPQAGGDGGAPQA